MSSENKKKIGYVKLLAQQNWNQKDHNFNMFFFPLMKNPLLSLTV